MFASFAGNKIEAEGKDGDEEEKQRRERWDGKKGMVG